MLLHEDKFARGDKIARRVNFARVTVLHRVLLDNRKVFCTPGPQTKPFERIFCRLINNNIEIKNINY